VLVRRPDVVPTVSQAVRSRCGVESLRARLHSKAWGTRLSDEPKERELQMG